MIGLLACSRAERLWRRERWWIRERPEGYGQLQAVLLLRVFTILYQWGRSQTEGRAERSDPGIQGTRESLPDSYFRVTNVQLTGDTRNESLYCDQSNGPSIKQHERFTWGYKCTQADNGLTPRLWRCPYPSGWFQPLRQASYISLLAPRNRILATSSSS